MGSEQKPDVMDLPGEKPDLDLVLHVCENWGYGRVIQVVQNAWSKKLQEKYAHSKHLADLASGIICVWCATDTRTGKLASLSELAKEKAE